MKLLVQKNKMNSFNRKLSTSFANKGQLISQLERLFHSKMSMQSIVWVASMVCELHIANWSHSDRKWFISISGCKKRSVNRILLLFYSVRKFALTRRVAPDGLRRYVVVRFEQQEKMMKISAELQMVNNGRERRQNGAESVQTNSSSICWFMQCPTVRYLQPVSISTRLPSTAWFDSIKSNNMNMAVRTFQCFLIETCLPK